MLNHLYKIQRGCGEITLGSAYNCDDPLQGSTKPRVIIFNKDDIAGYTIGATPGLITAITLKSGKSGYAFEGFKNSNTPSSEKLSSASGQPLFKHIVDFFIYENSQIQKNNIEKLAAGKFVIIIQNAKENADAFEVFGIGNGVELADGVVNNKNENNGAYHLIMNTAENQGEAKLPQTFFITSYAASLAAIEALLFLPTITNLSNLNLVAAGGGTEIVTGTGFHGSGSTPDVSNISWVNQGTQAVTNQPGFTVNSATQITMTANVVALVAGTYKLRITTSKGVAFSVANVTVT